MQILKKQDGGMILEGLVAMTIFVIGTLGIIKLEANLISNNGKARQRVLASMYTNSLIGMATADSANGNCYVVPVNSQVNCASTIAKTFTTNWVSDMTSNLPNSTATSTFNTADNSFTVTINWKLNQETSTHTYKAISNIGL